MATVATHPRRLLAGLVLASMGAGLEIIAAILELSAPTVMGYRPLSTAFWAIALIGSLASTSGWIMIFSGAERRPIRQRFRLRAEADPSYPPPLSDLDFWGLLLSLPPPILIAAQCPWIPRAGPSLPSDLANILAFVVIGFVALRDAALLGLAFGLARPQGRFRPPI